MQYNEQYLHTYLKNCYYYFSTNLSFIQNI